MERREEIIVIIEHLINDIIKTSNDYPALLEKTIVKNATLIEKYRNELNELKKILE